jgi:membrane-bound lytic murein transglycosylase D
MSRIRLFLVLSVLSLVVAVSAPALLLSADGQDFPAETSTPTVVAVGGENPPALSDKSSSPSPSSDKNSPALSSDKNNPSLREFPQKKTTPPPQPKKAESKPPSYHDPVKPTEPDTGMAREEEVERDIMEEALLLLNESQTYWVNGNLEDALEMLDQAYALLLDTNGDPDVARQKDDLRLMISKRILAIYNSNQTTAKGQRGEIPIVTNADVEKEIRLFQTVERDFFIASYQRSEMYRPIMVRELQKAGIPEELSWLPLVESGFKISALSSARALGLWQFIPSTGYKYGLNRDDWVDERMDIEKSTRAAIDYLKELHTMFGDWLTVLAAYNCGEGRVMRTIAAQHINYLDRFWDLYHQLPYETARYVPRFIATILIIRDPQKYGIDLETGNGKAAPLAYDVMEVNKSMRLQDIAQKLDVPEETINILNAELRLKMTPDRPYNLKIPQEMSERLLAVMDDIPQAEKPYSTGRSRGMTLKHKVRKGETLASIARRYKTSIGAIRAANRLSKREDIDVGQRLTIPVSYAKRSSDRSQKSEKATRYVVRRGDTLAALARKYDTTISDLKKINHMEKDILKTGQVLRIGKASEDSTQETKKEDRDDSGGKAKSSAKAQASKSSETSVKKYTVKKGDSLNRIAKENNMTLDKLCQLNSLARKHNIYPGQVILINK